MTIGLTFTFAEPVQYLPRHDLRRRKRRSSAKSSPWIPWTSRLRSDAKSRILKVDQVDTLRTAMATQLAGDLQAFLHGLAIEEFRERVIKVLKHGMSQTLGETREPANDVTFWAQSFGVASLYKSTLAALAMGKRTLPQEERRMGHYSEI